MIPTTLQALLDLGELIVQSGGAFYGLAVATAAISRAGTARPRLARLG